MTDPVKEQLSAYLDGELPKAELDLLLKQVRRDPQLSDSVGRYALLGEVLRTRTFPVPSAGFAARISQSIAAEAVDSKPFVAPAPLLVAPRWLRPAGGVAIAAGVAVLAVMALQPQQAPETAPVAMANSQAPTDKYIVPNTTATTATQLVPAAYLAKYVMAHSEYALPLGRHTSMLSSVLGDDESEQMEPVDISTPSDSSSDSSKVQP